MPDERPAEDLALSLAERAELAELEAIVEIGVSAFLRTGSALVAIRDQRLYRESHRTFEEYLADRWDLARSSGYEVIRAADIARDLSEISDTEPPRRISHALALEHLIPSLRAEVWAEVRAEHGDKVTAADVRKAVTRRIDLERGIRTRQDLESPGQTNQAGARSVERDEQTSVPQASNTDQYPPPQRDPFPDFEDDVPFHVEGARRRQRLLASYTRRMEELSRLIALEPVLLARVLDEERRGAHRGAAADIRRWLDQVDKELDRLPATPSAVHGEVLAPGQGLVPSNAHGLPGLSPTEVLGLSQDRFNAAAGATFADHDARLDAIEDAFARKYPEQWEALTGDAGGL